ncbi:hypothetical protein PG357_04085 [Riemerella anatipestifer]|nr:hypothetical protein [Riemerella anatipestifer]
MKTKTTKLSVFAFLGLGLMAYGQYDGKVGVNTDKPNATMEIKGKSTNTTDTLEGLIIPNVSKNKAFQMGGNTNIKESTLIYVDNLADYTTTPVDAKVADITENGYYFWNGTKWVKSAGSTIGNEWTYIGNGNYTNPSGHDIQEEAVALTRSLPQKTVVAYSQTNKTLNTYGGKVRVAGYNNDKEVLSFSELTSDGGLELYRGNKTWAPETLGYVDFKDAPENDTNARIIVYKSDGDYLFSVLSSPSGITTLPDTKFPILINLTKGTLGINKVRPKATLDINGNTDNTSNKVEGLLIPRVDKEKALKMAGNTSIEESTMIYINSLNLTSPADASVADITENGFYFWNGTKWVKSATSYKGSASVVLNGSSFERAALTGDITSTQNSNSVTVNRIQGKPVATTTPTSGQVLKWDGTIWAPSNTLDINSSGGKDYVCSISNVGQQIIFSQGNAICIDRLHAPFDSTITYVWMYQGIAHSSSTSGGDSYINGYVQGGTTGLFNMGKTISPSGATWGMGGGEPAMPVIKVTDYLGKVYKVLLGFSAVVIKP